MDQLESEFLAQERVKPWIWLRYIDDVFFIWTGTQEELDGFLERLNAFHPSIKFTHECSRRKINFLDVSVQVENGQFVTSLYSKETDRHQYMHFDSCHPYHTKKSMVYSQGLRLRRLCSSETDFRSKLEDMKGWFRARFFSNKLINEQVNRVKAISREVALTPSNRRSRGGGVPFVLTFNPYFENLGVTIAKLLPILYKDEMCRKVFTPRPFVSFRSVKTLRSKLVRAKVYPVSRSVGSKGCGSKRCDVCKNMVDRDTFSSTIYQTEYRVNHKFDCNSKCVVYLISCKVCGIQYVGQTCTDKFRKRWNNYVTCQRKAASGGKPPQNSFHQHFLQNGHNGLVQDAEITIIDKTDPSCPTKREHFWIDRLGTMSPLGLNGESEV